MIPWLGFILTFSLTILSINSVSASSQVVLNEIFPNAIGGGAENDEFIELYNTSNEDVDLSGWSIDDVADGGSKPYIFPQETILSGGGFLVLYKSDSSVALNNSGDHVRFLNKEGQLIDHYSYNKVDEGIVFGRSPDGGEWAILMSASPGSENTSALPTVTPVPTQTPTPLATPKPSRTRKPSKTPTPVHLSSRANSSPTVEAGATANLTKSQVGQLQETLPINNFAAPPLSSISDRDNYQPAAVGEPATTAGVLGVKTDSNKKKSGVFVALGGLFLISGSIAAYRRHKETL